MLSASILMRVPLCVLCSVLAGCFEPGPGPREVAEWDVVVELPDESAITVAASPDGAIFLATTRSLYRYLPPPRPTLQRIGASTHRVPQYLAAPSRDVVFHLGPAESTMTRWREAEGTRDFLLPSPEPWMRCGSGGGCPWHALWSLWARTADEAFAAGRYGVVLHFSRDSVRLETTPSLAAARAAGVDSGPVMSRYVSGNKAAVIAGGEKHLALENGSGWQSLAHVQQRLRGCVPRALVVHAETLYFAGTRFGPQTSVACIVALRMADTIPLLDRELHGFRAEVIFRGALQPDGNVLFHASPYSRGDVAVVRDTGIAEYRLSTLKHFGGAVLVRGALYALGQRDDATILVRARLD